MPSTIAGNIKKIKLSNGSVYAIFDAGALRLNENNQLVTGNTIVDELIINSGLYITEIDDAPVDGNNYYAKFALDQTTGSYVFQKQDTDKVLEDIGGVSYNLHSDTGVLELKIGK